MARTMLFISISPKRSARITVPWTALIYVPAPRPPLNPAASCRDALIGRELETGSPGGRRVCLHTSFFFFPLQTFAAESNSRTTDLLCGRALRGLGWPGPVRKSRERRREEIRVGSADPCWWELRSSSGSNENGPSFLEGVSVQIRDVWAFLTFTCVRQVESVCDAYANEAEATPPGPGSAPYLC